MTGKRTMIFVDAQNLVHGANEYARNADGEFDVDVLKLKELLSDGRDLVRSYWFDSYPTHDQVEDGTDSDGTDNEPGRKESFFYMLQRNGFRVDAKPLRRRDHGELVEKGADVGLATELLAHAFNDSYRIAVIVTGDADFCRPIRHVQDLGKFVEVASFESRASSDLKTTADSYVGLDDVADTIRR